VRTYEVWRLGQPWDSVTVDAANAAAAELEARRRRFGFVLLRVLWWRSDL
jgi:hypothetical protein